MNCSNGRWSISLHPNSRGSQEKSSGCSILLIKEAFRRREVAKTGGGPLIEIKLKPWEMIVSLPCMILYAIQIYSFKR